MIQTIIDTVVLITIVIFIVYYLWYFNLIMTLDQDLQTYHAGEVACNKSPIEIETVRYQTMNLHKNYVPNQVDNRVSYGNIDSIIIGINIYLLIASIFCIGYLWYNEHPIVLSIFIIIFISTIILLGTFLGNNFTNNKVIENYIKNYNELKNTLNIDFFKAKNINTFDQLPIELIKSLNNRYKTYNELTNYLKIPIISQYELFNEMKNKLETTVEDKTIINLDELMRFLKFHNDDTRDSIKNDIEILTGYNDSQPNAVKFYLLKSMITNPYESLSANYKSILASLWIVLVIGIYALYHYIYSTQKELQSYITIFTMIIFVFIFILIIMRSMIL